MRSNHRPEKHPFEPFLPEGAQMLFLGSFPPQPRRWSMPFYYPNFQNDFWRIMGLVFFGDKERFIVAGEKRFDQRAIEAFCRENGFAFYDTATEVIRLKDNASDAFLEVVSPTDIPALLRQIPHCRHIVVTGEKAAKTIAETLSCAPPPVGGFVDIVLSGSDSFGIISAPGGTTTATNGPSPAPDRGPRPLRLWRMPSTSRAYPLPLEKKAEAYRNMLEAIS